MTAPADACPPAGAMPGANDDANATVSALGAASAASAASAAVSAASTTFRQHPQWAGVRAVVLWGAWGPLARPQTAITTGFFQPDV